MIREIGSKVTEVIPFRTQVVVNHIEHDRESVLMASFDQPPQALGATVTVLDGKWINPIVTPIAIAWKLGHGHQLKRSHT